MKDFYVSNGDDQKIFLQDNKWLICSLIVEGVKKSIEENLESLIIFRVINPLENTMLTTELKKSDWTNSLNKCLSYYESIEEYEMCDKITTILKIIEDGTS